MKTKSELAMMALYVLGSLIALFSVSVILYQYVAALGSWNAVWQAMGTDRVLSALVLSITSSVAATIMAIVLGVPLAFILATRSFRLKSVLETLVIDVPQTFPPIAEGIILFLMLGPASPIGINLAFTFEALVLAKLFIAGPFIVSFVARRFRDIRKSGIALTAQSLGADQFQVFHSIYLPLSVYDIAAGSAMCWSRAMGELGGSLIFAGVIAGRTETIPTFISVGATTLTNAALAATLLGTTASTIALLSFKRLMAKNEG